MTALDPLDVLASLTDDVGRWWTCATDVQRGDAAAILVPGDDGPRRHWLGRAKGYSKTRDVAAMSIVVLLRQMAAAEMGYVAAADADQAGLVRQSIAAFRSHTSALASRITVESRRVVAEGARTELVILAADTAGSHGLRPKWLAVDELANWPTTERHHSFFDALWAGLPKVAGSRGIIMTTGGAPGHWARKIFELAGVDPLWRLSDVHGPPPWTDPAEVEAERRRLFPSTFARLWLNEWANADDAIADPADVDAACVLEGPLAPENETRYLCTLDVGTKNDRCVAVIAHKVRTADGTRVVVDRLQVWTPRRGAPVSLEDVRLWVTEMCRAYSCKVLYDPSQAYLMAEQFRLAHVPSEEFIFSASSVGRLATALMQALRGHQLSLPNDDELKSELNSVRLRETTPNVLRIDHKSGKHDDRVIALAMAVYTLTTAGGPRGLYPITDDEMAHLKMLEAQQSGLIPAPVQVLAPYGIGGNTSLRDAHIPGFRFSEDDEEPEDGPKNGTTKRSPFAP